MDTNERGYEEELRKRLSMLKDEWLLEMAENTSGEYTPDALQLIEEEVRTRGGLEELKKRIEDARAVAGRLSREPAGYALPIARLRKSYPFLVVAAYALFMYAIRASLWVYWLLLFLLIAWLLAVLFKPPFNPEDEIRELLDKAASESSGTTPSEDTNDSSPSTPH